MKPVYAHITNHERVIEYLGVWPSFDDFEVLSMLLDRVGSGGGVGPSLTIRFLGFRPEVRPDSPHRNNYQLTFRFLDVESLKLEGFNHQNAINGFVFTRKWSERLKREVFGVNLVQGFGVGCTFECSAIDILSVIPVGASDKPSCGCEGGGP